MLAETQTPDRIDIDRLQNLLSKDIQPAVETQIVCSPPRSPALVPRTPAKHSPAGTFHTAHDHSGNLQLTYSNTLTYSQVDLGETQVDDANLYTYTQLYGHSNAPEEVIAATPPPAVAPQHSHPPALIAASSDPPLTSTAPAEDLESQPEPSALFPEAHRFSTPHYPRQSPSKGLGRNPLHAMNFGNPALQGRMHVSLAQIFDSVSSPIRPRTASASLPPTPSALEAMEVMARTLSRVAERVESSPVPEPLEVQTEEQVGGKEEQEEEDEPTQPDPVVYISMQESQDARERKQARKKHRRRSREVSPVIFNSSYVSKSQVATQKIAFSLEDDDDDDDDEMVSAGEERKRRADKARRKGDEEVKRLFANASKTARGWGRAKSEETRKQKKHGKGLANPKGKRRATKSASPPATMDTGVEETGDEEDTQPEPIRMGSRESIPLTATAEDEDELELPMHNMVGGTNEDIGPAFTSDIPTQIIPAAAQTQYTQLPPDNWESLHQVPIAASRRSRPIPPLRQESSNISLPPNIPTSTFADSQPTPVFGGQKTSLKSLVPFNIPSSSSLSTERVPDFVKETSGLVAPTSSLTPLPSELSTLAVTPRGVSTVPSPAVDAPPVPMDEDARGRIPEESPLGKRKRHSGGKPQRKEPNAEKVIPSPVEEAQEERNREGVSREGSGMQTFAGIEEESGILSSRPEPDDVDMISIVGDVGAGRETDSVDVIEGERKGKGKRKGRNKKRVKVGAGKEKESEKEIVEVTHQPVPAKPKSKEIPEIAKSSRSSISKQKPKGLPRKTRSTTNLSRSMLSMPDTLITDPGTTPQDTDDDAGILNTTYPPFSVYAAPPPGASITVPERVFAWFRDGKTAYHPATVLESNDRDIKVAFDDGTEDWLGRDHIRALDLRVGDHIKVDVGGMKKSSWVVEGLKEGGAGRLTDCRGHEIVSVKAKGGEVVDVAVTNIYLVQTMWKHFSARVYNISPTRSFRHRTPSESFSTPTTPSKRRNTPMVTSFSSRPPVGGGVFANMVFALSFGDKESAKKNITNKIISNGGRIADKGFSELFFDTDSLSLRPEYTSTGFVAVIADSHSRRAKFLQALALGLPCLAGRWIEDCCKKGRVVEWEHYLLPAGESRYLGSVRSRTLEVYDARRATFVGVLERRRRLLGGRAVVVVGGGEKRRSYLFLTWAMGAGRVWKAGNLGGAGKVLQKGIDESVGSGEEEVAERWDYVYVDAKDREKAERMCKGRGKRVKVVDDEWVVQSLILGRLVDED